MKSSIINTAYNMALQSNNEMNQSHCAVTVSGGSVLSIGVNSNRSKYGKMIACSLHAEVDALRKLSKVR